MSAETTYGTIRADGPPRARRALRVGIGGPVGTGKSSLIAALCRCLGSELQLGVVTNDIYTTEDAIFLRSQGVLPAERIVAVQTGCCPHTAIRDDVSANLEAVEELERAHGPLAVVFVESGGDNLTAAFSPALADTQIFVLDTAGGDDVPRKGGPGVARSDLLVINKVDLAPRVGSDVARMLRDSAERRDGRPTLPVSLREPDGVREVAAWVLDQEERWRAGTLVSEDPGPPAPHGPHDHDHDLHPHAHDDGHAHAHVHAH
ncbi:urease accessory protein UreG [Conexibacter stalactiti]|uniref:Urease accessory protein UreG n=1 Tax=Conexibacter stalactiti TaxID=1940611 RepID=A0ABU4HTR0_9ACTN|nr:urease accessory protein UreG [Conexibacter stalactiti]MDW5596693.1 urease accessory protein UreG [Conexibacter stalactiti]MEC5037335.1 urease accessory protein UreG [Conexibacter stalactiti]